MFFLRGLLALLLFVAASAYGVAIAVFRRDKSRVAHDYAVRLARWIAPVLNLRVTVRNPERLHAARPCIFMPNHQSIIDVMVLARLHTPDAVVIGKKELKNVPFFGWLFEVTGNIYIDRSDRAHAVGKLKEAEEQVVARRVAVWIAPEGTRGSEPGTLLPFKKGAFQMGVHTGAPLVPVVTSPLKPATDVKRLRLRRNDVEVRLLEPIPTAGLGEGDIPALMEEARRRMYAALAEMSAERGITPPAEAAQYLGGGPPSGGSGGGPAGPRSSITGTEPGGG